MSGERFRGIYSIPVTPFTASGEADHDALARVVEFTIAAGAHGLVTPVNVSEFYTLNDDERRGVVETTVSVCAGRVPVVAGVTGPSTAQARVFAEHAGRVGADAVIAMPPYIRRATGPEVTEYFRVIAEAAGVPVFVQNAEGPAGTPMSAAQLLALAREVDAVSWVKEETLASSQRISEVLGDDSGVIDGVMGGKGARYLLDEYPRGLCGTMPGCEFTDLHAALWRALEVGDRERAHALHRVLLPLVSMEDQYGGAAFCKEVLRRRGVIDSVVVREPASPRLDAVAAALLDELLAIALDAVAALGEPVVRP